MEDNEEVRDIEEALLNDEVRKSQCSIKKGLICFLFLVLFVVGVPYAYLYSTGAFNHIDETPEDDGAREREPNTGLEFDKEIRIRISNGRMSTQRLLGLGLSFNKIPVPLAPDFKVFVVAYYVDSLLAKPIIDRYKGKTYTDELDEQVIDELTSGSIPMTYKMVQQTSPPGNYQLDGWFDTIEAILEESNSSAEEKMKAKSTFKSWFAHGFKAGDTYEFSWVFPSDAIKPTINEAADFKPGDATLAFAFFKAQLRRTHKLSLNLLLK